MLYGRVGCPGFVQGPRLDEETNRMNTSWYQNDKNSRSNETVDRVNSSKTTGASSELQAQQSQGLVLGVSASWTRNQSLLFFSCKPQVQKWNNERHSRSPDVLFRVRRRIACSKALSFEVDVRHAQGWDPGLCSLTLSWLSSGSARTRNRN